MGQAVEDIALLRAEALLDVGAGEKRLPLAGWQITQVAESLHYLLPPLGRETSPLRKDIARFLPLPR